MLPPVLPPALPVPSRGAGLAAGPIDPRSVEVFYWVVQLGGFRRAADRLHTTQPAVSARIAGLEAALGVRLLERGQRRRVRATAEGVVLLSYAERLLALTGEMQAAFSAGALTGVVRLGVAETIVHTWLATLMQRLHENYPRLEVDIVVDVSVNLRAQLLAGEVDVALLMGPVGGAGVQDLVLCDYAVAWVAAPVFAHRFAAAPLTLAALAGVPIVTYARATRPYQHLRALFAAGPAPRLFANTSLASIARMVLDGIGVGVIAPAAIGAELAQGRLVLLDGPALEPLRFTASWRDGPDSLGAATVARLAQDVAKGEQFEQVR